ncbi:hypothetical protein C1890_04860 [Pseudomonas sp. DP16D-R1]|nr:hypothetical protein C1890_04860 [Pseudomonas sp. DP16D-R1]
MGDNLFMMSSGWARVALRECRSALLANLHEHAISDPLHRDRLQAGRVAVPLMRTPIPLVGASLLAMASGQAASMSQGPAHSLASQLVQV